jgi:HK97 family phage major capsid protein
VVFSYYLIGDRQELSVATSPHVQFVNDRTVFRFIQRVDGRPWVDSALTPRNGTNTVSPYVTVAVRA